MSAFRWVFASHRHAAHVVRRTVAASRAYGTAQPSLRARTRIYLSVLRRRLSENVG
jgi:hypothetical protein